MPNRQTVQYAKCCLAPLKNLKLPRQTDTSHTSHQHHHHHQQLQMQHKATATSWTQLQHRAQNATAMLWATASVIIVAAADKQSVKTAPRHADQCPKEAGKHMFGFVMRAPAWNSKKLKRTKQHGLSLTFSFFIIYFTWNLVANNKTTNKQKRALKRLVIVFSKKNTSDLLNLWKKRKFNV